MPSASPALFPSLTNRGGTERFHWSLYKKNQEYQALAGFLAGAALPSLARPGVRSRGAQLPRKTKGPPW